VNQSAAHLRPGQLGTADVTASTVANIGPGIDFYLAFGVIATAMLVAVGFTVAIAGVFTMSGGIVALTLAHYASWQPARRACSSTAADRGCSPGGWVAFAHPPTRR
jgi:hypothetical protein